MSGQPALGHFRYDVDDVSCALCHHYPARGARPPECRPGVGVHHRVPLKLGGIERRLAQYQLGRVDQDIDAAQLRYHPVHCAVCIVKPGELADKGRGPPSLRPHRLRGCLDVFSGVACNRHIAAGLGEGLVASAVDAEGRIEAFHSADKPVAGVMWHPERDGAPDADRVLVQRLIAREGPLS